MRTIPQGLQDNLDSGATTLCWCWKIIRNDGVVFGFTEHDENLQFDNLLWVASAGLNPGVLESATGFTPDTGLATGALTLSGISADDIDKGKYDQAAIEIWRVDWQDTALRVGIWSGEIGDITRTEHGFEAEIAGPARRLGRNFGRVFSKLCDAELGDTRCTKDVSAVPFLRATTITRLVGSAQFAVLALNAPDTDWFSEGTVQWVDGENVGQTHRISQYFQDGAEDVFTLAELPVRPIAVGDAISVVSGCNKSIDHCVDRFSNILNFRGCPFMPGNDSIIAGPTEIQ